MVCVSRLLTTFSSELEKQSQQYNMSKGASVRDFTVNLEKEKRCVCVWGRGVAQ